jgi:hypothetical protein
MSTDNAARFYWGKLERAVAIFEAGNTEKAQDICCELSNEIRCPRFCQIEAWQLHSRCFPDNYWFAKSSLDQALEICISCESYDKATETDLAAHADVKKGVETMLQDRLTQYREHWAAKGREPPPKDEWYEVADGEAEDSADGWFKVATDENGDALPVWYNGSFLTAQELEKHQERECQHKGEQDKQETRNVKKEAAENVA